MNFYIYTTGVRTALRRHTASPFRQRCRAIHLYYAATTEAREGNHGIKRLKPAAPYEDPANIKIDLWKENPSKRIGRITLQKALDDYLRPGVALLPPETKNITSDPGRYFLVDFNLKNVQKILDTIRRGGARGAKEIHLQANPKLVGHQKNLLRKAFHMLASGMNVEFHVRTTKEEQSAGGRIADVQNRLDYVYLRPDVLGKALPETSGIIVKPQDAGSQVCWVVCGTEALDSAKATAEFLASKQKETMHKFANNQKIQEKRDRHKMRMGMSKAKREEMENQLKIERKWKTFKDRRAAAIKTMRRRDRQIAAKVVREAQPLATSEELLRSFEDLASTTVEGETRQSNYSRKPPKIRKINTDWSATGEGETRQSNHSGETSNIRKINTDRLSIRHHV